LVELNGLKVQNILVKIILVGIFSIKIRQKLNFILKFGYNYLREFSRKEFSVKKQHKKLWKKVSKMDLGNPVITALIGLVIFYIGLKTFSGGMKSMGNMEHLSFFLGNPLYMFFGGIIMTLLWQSSSLSTTAIIALVASGALPLPAAIACVLGANIGTTGTIWLAGLFVSDGIPKGDTLRIAMAHTGMNLLMAIMLLPFVGHIAKYLNKF
jgi:Na+/phosphate symporter